MRIKNENQDIPWRGWVGKWGTAKTSSVRHQFCIAEVPFRESWWETLILLSIKLPELALGRQFDHEYALLQIVCSLKHAYVQVSTTSRLAVTFASWLSSQYW